MLSVGDRYPLALPKSRGDAYLKPLISGHKKIKYDLLALLWLVAAVWFWNWWLDPEHILPGPQYWVLSMAFAWLFALQAYFIVVFRHAKAPAAAPPNAAQTRVAMVVTKAPSEPFSVVQRTLTAMLSQTYPHDTWLADEDPKPETVAWCEAHGVHISSRRDRPDYHRREWPRRTRCKEGNLAFFYDHYGYENYDFVSQLDADHTPEPTYLEEIMRGFADPKVGYVSAPSICAQNAADSWAARARLHNEAAFHGIFQCGYTGILSPMCIGSHYAVRTRALKQVGGLGPELAEDHSTTMLMNAAGWRGVHAIDAIARGDGPATLADLCTQEFQWSRSLLTLLLRYTPDYLGGLSPRLKFLFLFCQLFYPFFAIAMALLYFIPVLAVVLDMRYADVTYPAFLLHAVPPMAVMTVIAFALRHDGFFRPLDGRVLCWEKGLFLVLQWPWAFWGCLAAVRDRLTGGFVDFRITPKGEAAETLLPMRVLLPYVALAVGCLLPVLLIDGLVEAQGFYLLTALNGMIYTIIVSVIVAHHFRKRGIRVAGTGLRDAVQRIIPLVLIALVVMSVSKRGLESLYALSLGLGPFQLVRVEYSIAGAGLGGPGTVVLVFDPGWSDDRTVNREERRHGEPTE